MHRLTNDRRKWGLSALLAGLVVVVAAVLADRGYGRLLAHVWPRPIAFTTIVSPGEYALIDFESSGCFSFAHYRLRYEPRPVPRLLVTDLGPPSQDENNEGVPIRNMPKDLSAVELTPEQVARLDNLLRFYRKYDQKGGCTTSDFLSIVLYQNGYPVRQERFVDSTCESRLLADADPRDLSALKQDDRPVLSLWRVIAEVAQAKKRGLASVRYHALPRKWTGAYLAVCERQDTAREAGHARKLLKDLAGYPALCQEFRVHEVMLGDINLVPYSLHTTLTAIRPRVVDGAWWFDPVIMGRPRYNWNQFLAVHREVERVAARHTWISAWTRAGPGRSAEARIFGMTPTEETDLATSVAPAWKHAGLKGAPHYQLLLRRDDATWAELYFGKDDPRALIVMAKPPHTSDLPSSRHWLDGLELLYHPTEDVPDYVVVSPDGTWRRNTRPK